jgi:glycosyltransferase involved in cell wall biosynthesis
MSDVAGSFRILQVMEATLGGTRRYLENMFYALEDGPQNGLVYSLHRADSGFLDLLERMRAAGWTLFEIDMRRRIDPLHDAACVIAMRNVYRSFRPDVVHAHSSKAGAIARLATLGMRRRPGLVYSPHSIGVNLGWFYHPIEQLLARRLDILSAVSPSERDELRALKLLPASRVRVVGPTIRPDDFSPLDRTAAREALGFSEGPLVVAIGRLTEQKEPLTFVEFVAALRRRVGNVRAVWVGDGELREAMERLILERDLQDTVKITGWIDDVRLHLAACDLFVSTAAYESFGYVTAEALAMDRPVVASAITGTVDVVTTDVGDQLYRHRDIDGAVALAERLLLDSTHAAAVAQRGRLQVLSRFSVTEMRRGLSETYTAAVQR